MRIYSIGDEIKETDIHEITFKENNYYWFDLNPVELDDLNYEYFDFEYSSIEECANMSQVAKVDFFDGYTFIVLNALVYTNGVIHPDEFNVFLKKNCIITVSKEEVKIIKDLQNELLNYKTSVFFSKNKSPARILYFILDKLILNDYEIINKVENTADALEIQIMKNPERQFLNALLHLRHQVHTLRRCIAPLRYIGDNLLCNENCILKENQIKSFQQINSKIEKLIFSLESLVQYIVLVREAFEAEISNKTNELLKHFTIIAMFFSPLTLITGIYGMNFKIPECSWPNGYLYSISLMILVSILLFYYFKRKKWL